MARKYVSGLPWAVLGSLVLLAISIGFVFTWFNRPAYQDDSIPELQLVGTVQMDGQPLAGCHMYVLSPWPRKERLTQFKTDENGEFEVTLNSIRREAEGYSLWASLPVSTETELFAGKDLKDGVREKTSPGNPPRLRCNLNIPYRPGDLELKATVTDRQDLPYPGEEIELHAANRAYYLTKRLDAQGAATFKDLTPGDYHLQSLVPRRDGKPSRLSRHQSRETVFASADIKLATSPAEPVLLMPGGKDKQQIQGKITINGIPLRDISVTLAYREGGYWEYHGPWHSLIESDCELHSFTDSSGDFAFTNLPDLKADLKWETNLGNQFWEIRKEIQTRQPDQDFDIVATASIEGKVKSVGSGADLPSVPITARNFGTFPTKHGIRRCEARTNTNRQGEFLFEDFPAGEYEIRQDVPVRGPRPSFILKPQTVIVKEGEKINIAMEREY